MAFKWDRYFETGIAVIDQQHRGLVDIINEAAPLLTARGAVERGRLEVLLERLFDYAAVHFKTEEGLMRTRGLQAAYRDEHSQKHIAFVDQLIELRTQMGAGPLDETGPTLLRFLTSWLTFHILDEDQQMARQIRRLEQGETPDQARQSSGNASQDDQARAALVAALLDLHSVLAERNRTLLSTNERLQQVSTTLEETNRELEARVEARTHELYLTVEKMERTQSQLLQSEKMAAIGQLAAGVAHEINNPVGFVNSNIGSLKKYVQQLLELIDVYDNLLDGLPADDGRHRKIEQARQVADIEYLRQDVVDLLDESASGLQRVRKIVQDLKDFSRMDDSEWQEADLNAGLDSTLNVVWSELKYKAEVIKNYGELPPVHCVAAQINQVFMNLLVNAGQSIDGQGVITLSTGVNGSHAWVEISDTGAGMSREVMQRVFEPFFTTKPIGKGTGLGLSISWDIVVKKHGGNLEVDSRPGQGTRFRLSLPLVSAAATAANRAVAGTPLAGAAQQTERTAS